MSSDLLPSYYVAQKSNTIGQTKYKYDYVDPNSLPGCYAIA
ncbi:hypothetical protein CLV58_11986 [Spirosoma oryzae]|uniref:Uncharacterized protein n=1 Tax=Spirosoma oryzae TaxID=1469603 RepID=A0A2T0SKK1_9BACT|nr:hypothetical protein CLV58_11986 [Spirosoma oryzae]